MGPSGHAWPALDVNPTSPAGDPDEILGFVLASLDGCAVAAVEERGQGWRVYFSDREARRRASEALGAEWLPALAIEAVEVDDGDWARRSQQDLQPVRVGRVRIAPPWAASPGAEDRAASVEVVIQPSMGFGTGHHASTRLCTALLQGIELAGRSVLDVGTGSGVLAIVAARLGAVPVVAIDCDADALESARENLALNGLTAAVGLERADFRELRDPGRHDCVLANLTGSLLARTAPALLAAVPEAGVLVLSGITLGEERMVREAFEPAAHLETRLEEDGWVGLLYRKAGP